MKNNILKFFKGFVFAWNGITYAVKTQLNFRFHLAAAVWIIAFSLFYDLSAAERGVLFLAIGAVIALELVNTAVEKAVDLCTPEKNPLAKAAKDTAAGAVLVSAVTAVCVGVCLLWDTAVFSEITDFFVTNHAAAAVAVLSAAGSLIFIFKGI